MKSVKRQWVRWSVVVFFGLTLWASDSYSGFSTQGFSTQGFSTQGFSTQGFSTQGFSTQGFSTQGFSTQGFSTQGFSTQGFSTQGFSTQGFSTQGFSTQGFSTQGFSTQGFSTQGFSTQGFSTQGFNIMGPQLLGVDRLRGLGGSVELRNVEYALVQTAANLQVPPTPPSAPAISYSVLAPTDTPPKGIELRLGPGANETTPGTFIYVPNGSSAKDVRGTFWNLTFADAKGTGAIGLYIADWFKDTLTNTSKAPSNDDVYLYTVYYRHPATQRWESLCPVDTNTGKATAMAIPLDANEWTGTTPPTKFTFACTATGVGSKCARNWGYKPWKKVTEKVWSGATVCPAPPAGQPPLLYCDKTIPLKPFYDACLISARADYCQDGASYTQNGTLVDLFDTLDGFTSINATGGLPYTPGSPGVMVHEEYQISALNLMTLSSTVADPFYALTSTELMSLPPDDQPALRYVRRSGMQTSRYSDLDPGRSCVAAPYIDRCDPKEPYACYRDTNMSANPYGAFLAVNSPRHCDHDENTPGAPLDPLCNLCVTRVCSVDPSCCGDPGQTMYPSSLAWDSRCSSIRSQVCKDTTKPDIWPLGRTAAPAGSKPLSYRHGAIGSFEGIVTVGTTRYVEGWACDPDFPGASSKVQISYAGSTTPGTGHLGAPGATLVPWPADAPLKPEWRDTVGGECGESGRHGFRYPLPSGTDGREVYVYGFDMDTQAPAPLSLLRGGKKIIPSASVTPPAARSAIWSGFLEPRMTGSHLFSVVPGANDKYRVWVNGYYVAGNWPDNSGLEGAFAQPGIISSLPLVKGVRYPVRVEYFAASKLTLQWDPPDSGLETIPTPALYPAGHGPGNGLRGTYYPTNLSQTPNGTKTWSAVDYVWTNTACTPVPPATTCTGGPPAPGISVTNSFAARFEGQVMAPVSGTYLFTADTDDAVSIWVNGQLVTDLSRRPPDAGNKATCGERDICRTGAAISKTCEQGYFCSAQICLLDPTCCSITWDAQCLQEVSTICHVDCRQTAPVSVALLAGQKYDIKIELQHTDDPQKETQGVKLRLNWALDGGARDKVPQQYLFGELDTAAPGKGTGLNAAYFLDPTTAFTTEYLNRVDSKLDFAFATAPTVGLAGDIVCDVAGVTACTDTSTEVPGSPALLQPALAARIQGTSVSVSVIGAVPGATVTLEDTRTVVDPVTGAVTYPKTTHAFSASTQGTVAGTVNNLVKGSHSMTVTQTVTGKPASKASAPVTYELVDVVDTSLPPLPMIDPSTGGYVAANGKVTLGGTTTATQVTVKVGTNPTGTTFNATNGRWGGDVTLPSPGLYTLTISNTVGTKTSSTTLTAKYALPPMGTVTSPVDPETDVTGSVTISGTAAPGVTGSQLIVGDGDGRYFSELALTGTEFNVTTGAFAATRALDSGRHVLKIFQRVNGLDGDPVIRSVRVRPSVPTGFKIDVPAIENTKTDTAEVQVKGSGVPARTAMAYRVALYQQVLPLPTPAPPPVKLGEAAVTGMTFDTKVTLAGAGKQKILVRLLAGSLSGGGYAESLDGGTGVTTRHVLIKPPPPTISLNPLTTQPTSMLVTVAGMAAPNAQVYVYLDGAAWPSVQSQTIITASSTGSYSKQITFPQGQHVLMLRQTADGSDPSLDSRQTLLQLGDFMAPTINVAVQNPPMVVATSDAGAQVNVLTLYGVTASDGSVPLIPVCVPANNSTLPIGTTNVTCTAKDAAGNTATKTFPVTVIPSGNPTINNGGALVAEATGPEGAAVSYQVSATGFVSDCGPPEGAEIVPCTAWSPAYTGLGFSPFMFALDPKDGTLYASDYPADGVGPGKLYKSINQGGDWSQVSLPISLKGRLTVAEGTTSVDSILYVPSSTGLLAVKLPAPAAPALPVVTTVLPGVAVRGVSVDPTNRSHVFVWNVANETGPISLFETTDAGKTWTYAADGLPTASVNGMSQPHISDVAFDRLHSGRIYVQVAPRYRVTNTAPEWVYRRIGKGGWQRLSLPPVPARVAEAGLAVSPSRPAGQEYPTIYAAGLRSLDGGDTWVTVPNLTQGFQAIAFDATGSRVFGIDAQAFMVSTNGGTTFSRPNTNSNEVMEVSTLVWDPNPARLDYLYATLPDGGMRKTTNAGGKWSVVTAPGAPGVLRNVIDMAVDPVDPRTAYLLAVSGFHKTLDGGQTWALRTNGIGPGNRLTVPQKTVITIDPFNNRTIYLSGNQPQGTAALVSTDAGGDDGLPWVNDNQKTSLLAADPSAKLFFTTNEFGTSSTEGFRIVVRRDPGTNPFYALNGITGAGSSLHANALQVYPDAARTIALTYYTSGTTGGTVLFSARDSQVLPASATVRQATWGSPAQPTFDNSDGNDTLYVSGDALGFTPDRLYKAALDKASVTPQTWVEVVTNHPLGIDFRRLAIDPNSGGQLMYTLGTDDSLWMSQNGGQTWAEDRSAPSFMSKIWTSPLDGALFAVVKDTQSTEAQRQSWLVKPDTGAAAQTDHTLWKRSLSTTPPPGARIVQGTLRVTCKAVVAGVARSVRSGSVFPIATTAVTCTAKDVFNKAQTTSLNITVQDTTPPVVTVPAPITVTTTSTDPNVTVPVTYTPTPTAVDIVSGSLTPTCTTSPATTGNNFKLGVTTVTCTATDGAGNVGKSSFLVTVIKSGTTIPVPTLNVPANMTVEATTVSGGKPAAKANPLVSATKSTGGALTPTCTPAWTASTNFLLGTTFETCSVTDSGYTVTKTFSVTVTDNTAPVFAALPAPTKASEGTWGAHVTFAVSATDLGASITPICIPATGSIFANGTTTVTCKATDIVGNITTAMFPVVVTASDVNPPVLTVPELVTAEAIDSLGGRAFFTVSATDTESGPRPVDCAPASGGWFPFGESFVNCQTMDPAGHVASATFPVRIVDTSPPQVSVPATIQLQASQVGGAPAPFSVSAFDLVSRNLTPTCTRPNGAGAGQPVATGAVFPLGQTIVTCTATDGAGNTGSASFKVVVSDTTGPTMPTPPNITVEADSNGTKVVEFNVTATDWSVSVPVTCTPRSGSRFVLGTTTVTCVAYDGAGNQTRKTFTVLVRDTVRPTFTTLPTTVVAYATSTSGGPATYSIVATDAVDGVRPVTCSKASGSTFALNKTTVTCTAADKSGNTASASFVVWMQYNTTQTGNITFFQPPNKNGSTVYKWGREAEIGLAMQGVSASITTAVVRAQVATVVNGTPGTFTDAVLITGTNGRMSYNAGRYTSVLTTGNLTSDATTRFRADMGDGLMREVDFYVSGSAVMIQPVAGLSFGSIARGSFSAGGLAAKNIDTAAVQVSSVTLTGPNANQFSLTLNNCTGTTLNPGSQCSINVRFTPTTVGAKSATLTANTPFSGSHSVPLTGTGL